MRRALIAAVLLLSLIGQAHADYAGNREPLLSRNVGTGRKVVASAGTAEAISTADITINKVIVTAETDNTGIIVVGGSGVVASLSTRQGTPLSAGASVTLPVNRLTGVYIDATVTGDGVTFTYFLG